MRDAEALLDRRYFSLYPEALGSIPSSRWMHRRVRIHV